MKQCNSQIRDLKRHIYLVGTTLIAQILSRKSQLHNLYKRMTLPRYITFYPLSGPASHAHVYHPLVQRTSGAYILNIESTTHHCAAGGQADVALNVLRSEHPVVHSLPTAVARRSALPAWIQAPAGALSWPIGAAETSLVAYGHYHNNHMRVFIFRSCFAHDIGTFMC